MIGIYLDKNAANKILNGDLDNYFNSLNIGHVVIDVPSFETNTDGFVTLNSIINYCYDKDISISLYIPWIDNNEISAFDTDTLYEYLRGIILNTINIESIILGSYKYDSGNKILMPTQVITNIKRNLLFNREGQNLLYNPSFENSSGASTEWWKEQTAGCMSTVEDSPNSTYSLKVTRNGADAYVITGTKDGNDTYYFSVSPGDVIRIGGYVKTDGNTKGRIYAVILKPDNSGTVFNADDVTSTDWTFTSTTFTVPEGYVKMYLVLAAKNVDGYALFDEVFIKRNEHTMTYISVDHCEEKEVFENFKDHIDFYTIYKIDSSAESFTSNDLLSIKAKTLEGVSIEEMIDYDEKRIFIIQQLTSDTTDERMNDENGIKWLSNAFVFGRQGDVWVLNGFRDIGDLKVGLINASDNVKPTYYTFLSLANIVDDIGNKRRPNYYDMYKKRLENLYIKTGRINSSKLNEYFSTIFEFIDELKTNYNKTLNDADYIEKLVSVYNSYMNNKLSELDEKLNSLESTYQDIVNNSGVIYTYSEFLYKNIIDSKFIELFDNYITLKSVKKYSVLPLIYDPKYEDYMPYHMTLKLDNEPLSIEDAKRFLTGGLVFPEGQHTITIDLGDITPIKINYVTFKNFTEIPITRISFDSGNRIIENPKEIEVFKTFLWSGKVDIEYFSSFEEILGKFDIGFSTFNSWGYVVFEADLEKTLGTLIGIETDIRYALENLLYDDYFKLEIYTDENLTNKIYDSTINPYPLGLQDTSIMVNANKLYIKITLTGLHEDTTPIISFIKLLGK